MVRVSSSGVGRVESGSGGRVNAGRAALRADTGGMREGKGMYAVPRPVRDPGGSRPLVSLRRGNRTGL